MLEKIYFIRHGRTRSNEQHIYAGWGSEGLSPIGERGVREKIPELRDLSIEKVVSSPIQRAVQTAEIIDEYLNVGVVLDDNFAEFKMGPWEGLSEAEVIARYPQEWKIWTTRSSQLNMSGRETLLDLQKRVIKGINHLKTRAECKVVLVVTHVALIRTAWIFANNWDLDMYRTIDVPNAAIFLLDFKSGDMDILKK